MSKKINTTPPWPCSFCGKTAEEVLLLVTGPEHVCICDECIEICALLVCSNREKKRKEIEKEEVTHATGTEIPESETPETI